MPRVDTLIHKIRGATVLSTIDLTKGYWQIPLEEESKMKTAFATTSGLYHFTKMPFGLHGAAASFQRLMDHTLRAVSYCAVVYIDDILVFSHSWEEHKRHLRRVVEALWQAGLAANRKKSQIGQTAVQYLGFNIGGGKVWPVQDNVEALEKATPPHTRKELQSFLELANYYYRFIPNFVTRAAPLTDLLKGGGKGNKAITLPPTAITAFNNLKGNLCNQTRLHTPLDNAPFIVYTDASSTGLGAVLAQATAEGEKPILYLSWKLMPTEKKYAVIEKEALAMRWAIDKLRYYLWGQESTVVTDHAPLQWLSRMKYTNPRLMRWYLTLQPYRFMVQYRKGADNANGDFFSRQTV